MSRTQRQRFLAIAASAVAAAGVSALLPSAGSAQTTTGSYGGPEDLDLAGSFTYALDVGGTGGSRTVQGLTFTDDDAAGVTAASEFNDFGYQAPDYGATADDDNLEAIGNTIRWSAEDSVGLDDVLVDLAVTPGTAYKLQMLFQDDTSGNRGFDVIVEGATIVDNFGSSTGNLTSGSLITHNFTAGDGTLNIVLSGEPTGFVDRNAILSALTLEVVPEPGTLSLLGVAGLGLLGRRRSCR